MLPSAATSSAGRRARCRQAPSGPRAASRWPRGPDSDICAAVRPTRIPGLLRRKPSIKRLCRLRRSRDDDRARPARRRASWSPGRWPRRNRSAGCTSSSCSMRSASSSSGRYLEHLATLHGSVLSRRRRHRIANPADRHGRAFAVAVLPLRSSSAIVRAGAIDASAAAGLLRSRFIGAARCDTQLLRFRR